MGKPSFTTVVEHQTKQMLAAAKMLDDRGYIVQIWQANKLDPEGKAPFGFTTGLMRELVKCWKQKHRRAPVVVDVHSSRMTTDDREKLFENGRVFDYPFHFMVSIQRTTRLRHIVVALQLLSRVECQGRVSGNGVLLCRMKSNTFTFHGEGREQFQMVMRVLHYEHHREAMIK